MKKVFERIDLLCRNAATPKIVAARLHLWIDYRRSTRNFVCINLNVTPGSGDDWYLLPAKSDRAWRRKWREFLTDHADEVSRILADVEPESRDALCRPVS